MNMMNEDTIREFVKNLDYEDTQVLHKFLEERWKRKERYNVSFEIFLNDDHNYDIRLLMMDMLENEFSNIGYKVGEGYVAGSLNISKCQE